MIPGTPLPRHLEPAGWQRALQDCIRDPDDLLAALGLGRELLAGARDAAGHFALKVPRSYLARMRHGDPHDPLLRQVLPLGTELRDAPGFVADPVGDLKALAGPGLLHKYEGRALLVTTGACAVHCRYCFRREFPYAEQNAGRQAFGATLDAIRADASIREVLLSGGDPLTLNDRRLGELIRELGTIGHVRRVRIHTRLPVVLPERIDAGFLRAWNAAPRLQRVMVIHANHANELDASDVRHALDALRRDGATLLNQSVLLRGVNDSVATLADLSEALFAAGVLPYYVHVLDPVRGAAHFDVPDDEARTLMAGLTDALPGYLVPRLVREIPGAGSKTMLPPASR
jgi:EF-P beta-lysylation protein EpmB